MGWLKKVKKAVSKAVKQTGKAVTKAAEQTGQAVESSAKNFVDSNVGLVKDVVKGDIKGIVSDVTGIATAGTMSTTASKGIINPTSVAKAVGISTSASTSATSKKKKTGLLSQLRTSKGSGGGSYTETAKDSLGGEAGVSGK